jgi:hypothetical protein
MPVFRISAVRTEYHLIDAYVKARTVDEAEERFDAVLWDEAEALLWHQDLDSSDTTINSIEEVSESHLPIAVGQGDGRVLCAGCGETLVTPSSGTGWLHIGDSLLGLGIGL